MIYNPGPVIKTNFQDPSVIEFNGSYYAFAGANGNPPNINVQMATSLDFKTWVLKPGYDALPQLGSWTAKQGHLWSPDINQLPDGSFILYYSASSRANHTKHCVGAATSKTIAGPYHPLNSTIACDLVNGGAIDPDGFVDVVGSERNYYVVYKVDGNTVGHGGACKNSRLPIVPTPILLQQVSPSDGYTPIGAPVELLRNDASDGPDIEAPALMFDSTSGLYILIYNSGCFKLPRYRVKYATSKSLYGPYTKNLRPLLKTGSTAAHVHMPGGVDVSADGSKIIFQGDLNMGWFKGPGHGKRVRGMYAAALWQDPEHAGDILVGGLY